MEQLEQKWISQNDQANPNANLKQIKSNSPSRCAAVTQNGKAALRSRTGSRGRRSSSSSTPSKEPPPQQTAPFVLRVVITNEMHLELAQLTPIS